MRGTDRGVPATHDGIGSGFDQLRRDGGEPIIASVEAAAIDCKILALHETVLAQFVEKCGEHACRDRHQHGDAIDAKLLRARRNRPSGCRAAERSDQFPPGDCHVPLPC